MAEDTSQTTQQPKPKRKPLVWRFARFVLFFLLILLGLIGVCGTGFYVWLGSESGMAFVQKQINSQAGPMLASSGLALELKQLRGQLPRHFVADLDLADGQGTFLHLPETRFTLAFGVSPLRLEIKELCLKNAVLERLPKLPASPPKPEEPTAPLTPQSLRELLRTSLEPILTLPEELPDLRIAQVGCEDFSLPAEILGFPAKVTALCDLSLHVEANKLPKVQAAITSLRLESQDLGLSGSFAWQSGESRESWLAGQVSLALRAHAKTGALLKTSEKVEKGEAQLSLDLTGPLLAPKFSLALALDQYQVSGQILSDCAISLQSRSLDLERLLRAETQTPPLQLDLAVNGKFNGEPLSTSLALWAELVSETSFEDILLGVKNLDLKALGLVAKGNVSARLGQGNPQLTGELTTAISDWHALAAFVPDKRLSGTVTSSLKLASGSHGSQDLDLHIDVPNFSLVQAQAEPLRLEQIHVKVALADLFAQRKLLATLAAGSLALGPQKTSLNAELSGTADNLALNCKSQGVLRSDLALRYEPGKVEISRLQLSANAKAFTGKDALLGVNLKQKASVAFGDNSVQVSGLDLSLLPKGQLSAKGSLASEKYAFQLALKDLDLEAWQSVLKDLPKGRVNLSADLAGTAANPSGKFKVTLAGLALPKVRLKPLDLSLHGKLSAAQGLGVQLEMPPNTLEALGAEKMALTLSVPLQFSEGVPALAENANLSGKVFWQGKLAPLWKLSPLSDRRLTGDLHCDIKLAGSPKAPLVNGALTIDKARFEDPLLGVLLRDIGLKIAIDGKSSDKGLGGQLKLSGGLGDGMGGKLSLDGSAGLDGEQFRVQTKLDHLRPLRREDIRISLSGEVVAQGKPQAPDIGGLIIVDNGAVQLESIAQGAQGVTTLPIEEKTKQKSTSKDKAKDESGRLHLAIRSPGRFIVDGYGMNTEWKTDLTISGSPQEPVIAGSVSAVKGNLELLNKNFELEKGEIILGGGNVANPLLDILMTNTTPNFTSHVRVSGTVKKMKLSLTSEPEMPQDDVLAHILFGRNAKELGRYEALQLAAATARLASGLGRGLNNPRKALGMDVMRLKDNSSGQGSSDSTGMGTMAVETGKYLNDSIYVGVEQGAGEGSTAGIVQLEITPKLKLELRSQGNNTQGSLNWKHNY